MDKIYIVSGSTGEWSDRTSWTVAAFSTEGAAQEYLKYLETTYRQFPQENRGFYRGSEEMQALEKVMSSLDPGFYEDYTGTYWYIDDVKWKG